VYSSLSVIAKKNILLLPDTELQVAQPEAVTLLSKAKAKAKAVPLYAMEVIGGRGGIAPTHSQSRH
jgi:hypothetical protein